MLDPFFRFIFGNKFFLDTTEHFQFDNKEVLLSFREVASTIVRFYCPYHCKLTCIRPNGMKLPK